MFRDLKNLFDFKFRWFDCISLIALVLTVPATLYLPISWGWENHPIENFQVVLQVLGLFVSFHLIRRFWDDKNMRNLCWCSIPFWLLVIGRELSWGRVFFPLDTFPDHPPAFTAKEDLSYGPFVDPIIGVIVLIMVIVIALNFRWSKIKTFVRIPFYCIIFGLVCFAIAYLAENIEDYHEQFVNYGIEWLLPRLMLIEEYTETICFWCMVAIFIANAFPREETDLKSET